jgi:hypothetical protein
VESGRPYSRLLSRLQTSTALSPEDRQRIADEFFVKRGNRSPRPSRCTLVLAGFLYSHKLAMGWRRQITSFLIAGDLADLHTLYLSNLVTLYLRLVLQWLPSCRTRR